VAIAFGKVPHPVFRNRPITKPENFGQNDLGQRTVKGVVWHRMIGTLEGTFMHFSSPNVAALTDYGVGVEAQDGAAKDGIIDRYNDPLGRQAPMTPPLPMGMGRCSSTSTVSTPSTAIRRPSRSAASPTTFPYPRSPASPSPT
jgi:hypothetical protein